MTIIVTLWKYSQQIGTSYNGEFGRGSYKFHRNVPVVKRLWSSLPVQQASVLASPQFKRVNRKWRLYFKQGIVRLRFIIKTRGGRRKAFQQDDVAHLKEGAFIEANTTCSQPPEFITVRIEVSDPSYIKT
ncbi:uncharacterized protein [Acropora muricata]|uniref:uncharacterized protein n=1 Tax=Acropora muricata TaxID=159855 RepID=UPI0034E4CF3E